MMLSFIRSLLLFNFGFHTSETIGMAPFRSRFSSWKSLAPITLERATHRNSVCIRVSGRKREGTHEARVRGRTLPLRAHPRRRRRRTTGTWGREWPPALGGPGRWKAAAGPVEGQGGSGRTEASMEARRCEAARAVRRSIGESSVSCGQEAGVRALSHWAHNSSGWQ